MAGSFLGAVEATIVSTAMPTVVDQLGGLAHYSWVFSAYILTSTVTMPLWGKLSDLYGRRPFYLASIGLFVLGSALSGAAQSMTELIVYRAIQGLGAGGLLPLGMTIIGDLYTLEERARMQGLFSSVWGIASVIGPLVGGLITEQWSWRWVFFLNLPLGAGAAALAMLGLPRLAPGRRPRIDFAGVGLLVASLSLFMVALTQTADRAGSLPPAGVVLMYVAAVVLGARFVIVERRAAEPILPLDLLVDPFVSRVTLCSFLLGVAMFGSVSFVPLFIQSAMGGTATEAGSAMTPLLMGWVLMSIVTGRVLPRLGHRPVIGAGLTCITAGFVGLSATTHDSPLWSVYAALALVGLGLGMAVLALMLALQASVERSRLGVATSLGAFSRSMGGAVGVALLGAVVAFSLPTGGTIGPVDMELALHRAFVVATALALAALVTALRIPRIVPARPAPATGTPPPEPLARGRAGRDAGRARPAV